MCKAETKRPFNTANIYKANTFASEIKNPEQYQLATLMKQWQAFPISNKNAPPGKDVGGQISSGILLLHILKTVHK